MNPVLTQLPKAQDAYMAVIAKWAEIDTSTQLLAANTAINDAIAKGQLSTHIAGIEDCRLAEKVAIELQELGYNTACVSGGHMQQPDNSIKPLFAVTIGFKWMPHNARDGYTV